MRTWDATSSKDADQQKLARRKRWQGKGNTESLYKGHKGRQGDQKWSRILKHGQILILQLPATELRHPFAGHRAKLVHITDLRDRKMSMGENKNYLYIVLWMHTDGYKSKTNATHAMKQDLLGQLWTNTRLSARAVLILYSDHITQGLAFVALFLHI